MFKVHKKYRKPLLKPETQAWELNNDIIFPSVLDVRPLLKTPIDSFYMYFAPHDPPGGIGIATAPSPEGPWNKHSENPILERSNALHSPLAHVSSPHVIWDPRSKRFLMYYHGHSEWQNQKASQTTGVAVSNDGINWTKMQDPIIDSDCPTSWDGDQLTYARVTLLSDGRLVMIYMGRDNIPGAPKLGMAFSNDGINWKRASNPFLSAGINTQAYISTGHLIEWRDKWIVFYVDESVQAMNSTIHAIYSSDKGATWTNSVKILSPGKWYHWNKTRVHDPCALVYNNSIYLFYAGGKRKNSKGIGLVTLKPEDIG